jgi:hypothetical protein
MFLLIICGKKINSYVLFDVLVLYLTLLHLPPLRMCCVGGCWDRTRIDLIHNSARSRPHLARFLPYYSVRSYPHFSRSHTHSSDIIHTWLDLIYTRLDLVHTRLDLIHTRLDSIHTRLDLILALLDLIHTRLDLIRTRQDLIYN